MKIIITLLVLLLSATPISYGAVNSEFSGDAGDSSEAYPDIPEIIAQKNYSELEKIAQKTDINARFKTERIHVYGLFGTFEDNKTENPLMCATYFDDMVAIEILVKHGARISDPYETILPAALYSSAEAFLYYYNKGMAKKCSDETLMYYVVEGGNLDLLKFLIERGHKFDARQKGLIHCVVRSGNIEMLKFLIEHGADVNQQYNYYGDKVPFLSICGDDPTPLDSCFEEHVSLSSFVVPGEFNYEGALQLLANGANPYKTEGFYGMAQGGETRIPFDMLLTLLHHSKGFKISPDQDKFLYINLAMLRSIELKKLDDFDSPAEYEDYTATVEKQLIEIVEHFLAAGAAVSDEAIHDSGDFKSEKLTAFLMDNKS